jgi:hypothetical protein
MGVVSGQVKDWLLAPSWVCRSRAEQMSFLQQRGQLLCADVVSRSGLGLPLVVVLVLADVVFWLINARRDHCSGVSG